MNTYVALLLGINIGSHKRVPMAELKVLCEAMGLKNVKTILATGNVIFDYKKESLVKLEEKFERELKAKFGFEVRVIVHEMDFIKKMIAMNPFRGIEVTKATRLYVTFYAGETKMKLKTPFEADDKGSTYKILKIKDGALYGVFTLGEDKTTGAMEVVGKLFGKENKTTMRNWNTVQKLVR